jgi:hypothetical protein
MSRLMLLLLRWRFSRVSCIFCAGVLSFNLSDVCNQCSVAWNFGNAFFRQNVNLGEQLAVFRF